MSTKSNPKCKGLDADVYFPCKWDLITPSIAPTSTLVCQYGYNTEKYPSYYFTMDVYKYLTKNSPDAIKKLTSSDVKEKLSEATLISSKQIEIGKATGAELISYKIVGSSHMKMMRVYLFANDYAIAFTYTVSNNSKKNMETEFENMKGFFTDMYSKSDFK